MGIDLMAWRQRVGSFFPSRRLNFCWSSSSLRFAAFNGKRCVSRRVAYVICMLLLMAGVESNPGPTVADLSHRIDDIFAELKDLRAVLTTKIDDSFKDVSAKILSCEQRLTLINTRLDTADAQRTTMQADIDALKTQVHTLSSTAPSTATTTHASTPPSVAAGHTPLSVNDIARELRLRATKEANIIISGMPASLDNTDAKLVENLLHDELNISTNVLRCSRLGKPDQTRPQLVLATLAHASDAREAIKRATALRTSTNVHVRNDIYINPDLTQEQRSIQYKLRTELRLRKAAGELHLIIKNSSIVTRKPPTTASASSHRTRTSAPATTAPLPSSTGP